MAVLTISRQEGCGGEILASRLAKVLDYRLVDKEILTRVASLARVTVEQVEAFEKRTGSLVERFLLAAARGLPELDEYYQAYANLVPETLETMSHYVHYGHQEGSADFALLKRADCLKYFESAIRDLAERGNVIIIGRGTQVLLADFPHTLHLRVVATEPYRAAAVARPRGLDHQAALKLVRDIDQHRSDYVRINYRRDVDDPTLYDLVLRMDRLKMDEVVEFLRRTVIGDKIRHRSETESAGA